MNRPCKCGCSYAMHYKVDSDWSLALGKSGTFLQCRNCTGNNVRMHCIWCRNYTPINNLEYLERKYDQTR